MTSMSFPAMSLIQNLFSRTLPAALLNRTIKTGCNCGIQTYCTFTQEWTEAEYEKRSEETLTALNEYLDLLPERVPTDPAFDVSYSMGVLTVHIGRAQGTYVINKQTPNKQIWLSSPVSGPKRYDLSDSGRWAYKRDGQSLHELLQRELRQIYGGSEQIQLLNLP